MKKQIILLFHLSYWIFYVGILLIMFFILQVGHTIPKNNTYFFSLGCLFVLLPSILGFYSFYHFLFKTYLKKRSLIRLFSLSLGAAVLIAMLGGSLISLVFGKEFMFKNGYESFSTEMILMMIVALINGIMGFVLKGFVSWYGDLKIKEALQKSTHTMELELIKSKLDPHFLFNTINNIDGLMIKDVNIASKYLDKLSTILRFMLYESKVEKISLAKEVEYIQKYIDLQKIRTSNPKFVKYTVTGLHNKHQIPAMLFIPVIENAFKHVAYKKVAHAICIDIKIKEDQIVLNCKNNFVDRPKTSNDVGGIGNELIKKRLDLVYPEHHSLEVIAEDGVYHVQLTIMTNEN